MKNLQALQPAFSDELEIGGICQSNQVGFSRALAGSSLTLLTMHPVLGCFRCAACLCHSQQTRLCEGDVNRTYQCIEDLHVARGVVVDLTIPRVTLIY